MINIVPQSTSKDGLLQTPVEEEEEAAPATDSGMYNAYSFEPVLQNLPATVSIESAAVFRDWLLLGTKQGPLIVFTVTETQNTDQRFDAKLLRTNKNFSKKALNNLVVVEPLELLISLSDGVVCVHSITDNFKMLQQFQQYRGATLIAVRTQTFPVEGKDSSLTTVKLCIAIKRKLFFLYWKHNWKQFTEYPYDHSLPDHPRCLVWSADDLLIVGFKTEYILLKCNISGDMSDLIQTGKQPEPVISRFHDNLFGMLKDKHVVLSDSIGKPVKKYLIPLNDYPVAMTYDFPYLIATSLTSIEIRSISPHLFIQDHIIPSSPKPHLLIHWKVGRVFAVSANNVWCMLQAPLAQQMDACKLNKQFQLALKLTSLLQTTDEDKKLCEYHINNLLAFEYFVGKEYKKALRLFEQIHTDPLHVIGLFPTLMKEQYRQQLTYPGVVPDLGEDLNKAVSCLSEYLKSTRTNIIKEKSDEVTLGGILEGTGTVRPKKQLLQIIDTTILKCYLKTNPSLVASLLRFRDNECHLEESEAALLEYHKYAELVILYEQKGHHKKALQLLLEQAHIPDSPLKGHERTVQYLQRLSPKYFDLMLEYAKWVIDAFPDEGLKIFIEGESDREELPREKVLQFLTNEALALIVQYLEHVILVWKDDKTTFHNMLIYKYREEIMRLASGNEEELIGDADGPIRTVRNKLVKFLRTSNYFTVSKFPQCFLGDRLYQECAIVMGKLGRHQDALTIYIHVLRNLQLAEEYCLDQYHPKRSGNKEVFVILLQLYLTPAEICLKALQIEAPPANVEMEINVVLDILYRHVDKMEPLKAFEMIPQEISLGHVVDFITGLLDMQTKKAGRNNLLRALLLTDYIKAKCAKMEFEKEPLVIKDTTLCDICAKRINKSVFVLTEQGQVVHYGCQQKRTLTT